MGAVLGTSFSQRKNWCGAWEVLMPKVAVVQKVEDGVAGRLKGVNIFKDLSFKK